MFKKIIHAKPSYTNTSGSDQNIPSSYDPTLTHTVLKSSYSVPSGKRIIVRNITIYKYYASAIKNIATSAYNLYGSPLIAINNEIFILTDIEKTLGSILGNSTASVTYYPIIANLSMFMVLEPGDVLEVGLIIRAHLSSFYLTPNSTHSVNVHVSGVEL